MQVALSTDSDLLNMYLFSGLFQKKMYGGWKAHYINNTWVMGIRATFHTIMHYNSQLQLSWWRVLTKTAFQPPTPLHFFSGIALIKYMAVLQDIYL